MAKGRSPMGALAAVPENEIAEDETGPAEEVLELINSIEAQLEERIASIVSAANDAVTNLRNDINAKMVRLPKKTKEMTLKELQEKFPDDFKTGALMEIRQRYAAMAEAAQNVPLPPTNAKGGRKRAAEPMTVMQTVKTRRTAAVIAPSWGTNNPSTISATVVPPTVTAKAARVSTAATRATEAPAAATGPSKHAFNGLPLQTPMPFAGEAVSVPITMVAQKRGGRTKAVPAPQAAVITTTDGMQWALGKEGTASIPDSHRAEVEEMLSAQFNFIAAALGKTVFGRNGGRGGRKRG